MISLEVNGITVPVLNPKIRFNLKGQIFNTEVIPGGNSFPFEVAITKESQAAFNYPDVLGNRDIIGSIISNCKLYFGGAYIFSGTVMFLSVRKTYRVTFNFGVAGIKPVGQRSLRSFVYGGIRTFPEPSLYAHGDTVAGSPDDYDYVFPMFKNENLYQGFQFTYNGLLANSKHFNAYLAGAYQEYKDYPPSADFDYYTNSMVPFYRVPYLVRQIFKESGIRFKSDFLKDPEIFNLVLYNSWAEDKYNLSIPLERDPADDISVVNHLPDVTVSELVQSLRNKFNLFFNWNFFENSLSLETFNEVHKRTDVLDLTDRIIPTPEIEPSYREIANFKYNKDSNDSSVLQEDLLTLINTEGADTIDMKAALMDMDFSVDDFSGGTRNILIPHSIQAGNSNDFPYGNPMRAPFALRFLFYRGMQPDSNGNDYPLASVGNQRWDQSEIAGTNYSLYLDGEKGLYNVWWKDFLELVKNSRRVTVSVRLSLDELISLDLSKKVRIKNSLFYIADVEFEMGRTLSAFKLELYRI